MHAHLPLLIAGSSKGVVDQHCDERVLVGQSASIVISLSARGKSQSDVFVCVLGRLLTRLAAAAALAMSAAALPAAFGIPAPMLPWLMLLWFTPLGPIAWPSKLLFPAELFTLLTGPPLTPLAGSE